MFRWILVLTFCSLPWVVKAELPLGEIPKEIVLSGENGGKLNGESWNSSEIKGKVFALFHVDPDEADLNNGASEALKAKDFDKQKYGSYALINMAATWLPDFALEMKMESKQKEYPDTIYVKDLDKILVKEWKLADDSSNVVIFDRQGKVIFSVDGKLNQVQIDSMLQAVKDNL